MVDECVEVEQRMHGVTDARRFEMVTVRSQIVADVAFVQYGRINTVVVDRKRSDVKR